MVGRFGVGVVSGLVCGASGLDWGSGLVTTGLGGVVVGAGLSSSSEVDCAAVMDVGLVVGWDVICCCLDGNCGVGLGLGWSWGLWDGVLRMGVVVVEVGMGLLWGWGLLGVKIL